MSAREPIHHAAGLAVAHRVNVVAADSGLPPEASYQHNDQFYRHWRVYCRYVPSSASIAAVRVWTRKPKRADDPQVYLGGIYMAGETPVGGVIRNPFIVVSTIGIEWFTFSVPVDDDDVFVELMSVTGAPASFRFDCWLSGRF